MLKIRLQRIGKKKQAYFRVVVMEHTRKTKGPYVEDLGSYDPHKNEFSVDAERVKYWLGNGAQMSPTVNNLLVGKGVIEGEKVQVWKAKRPQNEGIQSESQKGAAESQKEEAKLESTKPEEEKKEEMLTELSGAPSSAT